MTAKNTRSPALLLAILLVMVGMTVAIAYLWVEPEHRTQRFAISLGAIVFAELLAFGYPIYFSLSGASRNSPRRIMGLGLYPVLLIYGAITLLLAMLATTAIDFKWLGILHIASLGMLMAMLLTWKIGSNFVGATATQEAFSRNFINDARRRIALQNDLPGLSLDIRALLGRLDESARFSISESCASAMHAEGKILLLLDQLDALLLKQPEHGSAEPENSAKEFSLLVESAIYAFKEREHRIRSDCQ